MSNEQQAAALIAHKATIDAALARLQAFSDEHFGVAPDDVTWGDVSSIGELARKITLATDWAFAEGENA